MVCLQTLTFTTNFTRGMIITMYNSIASFQNPTPSAVTTVTRLMLVLWLHQLLQSMDMSCEAEAGSYTLSNQEMEADTPPEEEVEGEEAEEEG